MTEPSGSELQRPTLVIVDALQLRRAGIVSLLRAWADAMSIRIIEALPTGEEKELSQHGNASLVVLSIGGNRIEDAAVQLMLQRIRTEMTQVPLVIISDCERPEEAVEAFRAGARAFIPTSTDPAVAIEAFTFILHGGSFFPPTALMPRGTGRAGENGGPGPGGRQASEDDRHRSRYNMLTSRQHEVLELLREGQSNKLIARALSMRESTVKVHVRQIMRKLGAANRTQAALCAGLLPPDMTKDGSASERALPGGTERRVVSLVPSAI